MKGFMCEEKMYEEHRDTIGYPIMLAYNEMEA